VFTYVYSRYALCLLLQILFVAALDIKTRDVPTVSSVNSLLSQYLVLQFLQMSMYGGWGPPTFRFAPVVPWAQTGLFECFCDPFLFCKILFVFINRVDSQALLFMSINWSGFVFVALGLNGVIRRSLTYISDLRK
jgi:hypothetical protein